MMAGVCVPLRWAGQWTSLAVVLLLLASGGLRATHIIGGDISMQAVGTTPGLFRIQLNQYWDQTKVGTGNRDPFITLLIYQKQNPRLVDTLRLSLREELPLTFNNSACAKSLKLNFTEARYSLTHQFDPARYTDSGGYYIVWERCCRNDALTNAVSVGQAGIAMVFYLEFPPMQVNNRPLLNSSPDFGIPNGNYVCINKPFVFNAGATDANGDQLRYSLVTPLNGYANRTTPLGDKSVKASYPTVTWAPGIGLANVIPGNPPLSINPATGQIRVRATTQGLYLFTVQCEEFRNGQRIGLVRRDFQLPVLDCSVATPPPAVVSANTIPQTDVVWCPTQPLTLTIPPNPLYAYQWQKDGANLRGDTLPALAVKEGGRYTVVTSQAKVCSNDTVSQAVRVTALVPPSVTLSLANQQPVCTGDTVIIRATGQPGYRYRWRRNRTDVAGEQQATLRTSQPGRYAVLVRAGETECEGSDTIEVVINARPVAQLTTPTPAFCPDASAQVVAQEAPGNRYAWQRNGFPIAGTNSQLTVQQPGNYRVLVSSPAGCTAVSQALTMTRYEIPVMTLDSVPPICASDTAIVLLRGQPGGGVYTGPGVTGDRFDAVRAGTGQHQLTYSLTTVNGCRASQSRVVVVRAGPVLTGAGLYQIVRGDSVRLQTQANEPILRYGWDPPTDLSRADVASPVSSPAQTSSYQLTAVGPTGCQSTLPVRVEVIESLYIPSAFTPNGDGLNDSWQITNAAFFPLCEVAIYNRWGELVFYSKGYTQPWDGVYQERPVDGGVYSYQIATGPGFLNTTYRGKLTVIR